MTRFINRFTMIILIGVLFDQLSKFWAITTLNFFEAHYKIGSWISFQLVYNHGAAYGIFQHQRAFLLTVSFFVMIGVGLFYRHIAQTIYTKYGLCFLLIGTIGNFLDRLRLGYVVDFINTPFFPVFNLSDVCIDIGIAFFVLDIMLQYTESNKSSLKSD